MNINSKINWQVGLELTEQTFRGQEAAIEGRILALRSALNSGQFGLLPDSAYYNQAIFVKRNLEIPNLQCKVLVRSGDVIDVDENVELPITLLYEDLYYVVVSLDKDNLTHFSYEGVPMVRPTNKFEIVTPQHLAQANNLFPLIKLHQENGAFKIDSNFIPPMVMAGTSSRMMELLASIVDSIEKISNHANLEPGEATLAMRRWLFQLRAINERSLMSQLTQLLHQISQALDYYILTPHALNFSSEEIALDLNDIDQWINWFIEKLGFIVDKMDGITLEDRSIDYEKLKSELYGDLSQMLRGEIYKQMYEQLSVELREEIARDVKTPLMSFITGEVRQELHNELKTELMSELEQSLSPELYDKLYNALYVEEERVEEVFTPII